MNEMTRILQDLDVLGALSQWFLWPYRRNSTDSTLFNMGRKLKFQFVHQNKDFFYIRVV